MVGGFCTLEDAALAGKRVLLRVDLNVPMKNGVVTDVTRLERVTPTIAEIADKGGKVILLSHLGRPKGRDPALSLRPAAAALAAMLDRPVGFVEDCIGPAARAAVAAMRRGEQRRGLRGCVGGARRSVGQRCVFGRAPRPCFD